ncbi:hypothetical protein Ddye_023599 [Dipteronia dyeriana]|uniref:Uncharacterized protein n=1 Tax=Dipteronia dyeriana TaxID=168575 RepID=A0AAD9WST1_9ROSI|nr:hypothetical protein Ddye_023599 [Dipteronia dyeriana]
MRRGADCLQPAPTLRLLFGGFLREEGQALATVVKPREEKPRPQVTFTIKNSNSEENDSRSKTTKRKKVDEGLCAFLKNCSFWFGVIVVMD